MCHTTTHSAQMNMHQINWLVFCQRAGSIMYPSSAQDMSKLDVIIYPADMKG